MWQPIETAPRNQTFLAVLNCAGEQTICTMRWPVAEAKNSRPDSKTFHVERVTHWMPLPDLPGAQAQNVPKVVAYLDLGVGGYMDIGTDLTNEELATLPKGRHMLGIVGTYGVDGYVPAQPAPSVPDGFSREDLEAVADGLDGYEKTVNVGNVTGGGDDHLESTTAYAARFIRAMLAAAPEAKP